MSEKAVPEKQPLINQRATLRLAVGLLIIAGLIFGFQYLRGKATDPYGSGSGDTSGSIAALMRTGPGIQAVLVKPNGEVQKSPGYREGANDRDLTWRPDGNQLFFSSDREPNETKRAFNIYRWNLGNNIVEPRTHGTIGRSAPSFSPSKMEDTWPLLMVTGGNVWELDPRELVAERLIPYSKGERTSTGQEAAKDSGDTEVGRGEDAGASALVRLAKWGKDREFLFAIRRTETGEALIVQNMTGDAKKRVPMLVLAGDRIDFAVNPVSGEAVIAVQGFQWPDPNNPPEEAIHNGRAVKPFLHYVAAFDPNDTSKPPTVLVASKSNAEAYATPSISPDGSTIAMVVGKYEQDSGVRPIILATLPSRAGASTPGGKVADGEIYDPSWHPNGTTLVFIRRDAGKRKIFTIEKDGSNETLIVGDADYFSPMFSPQSK